MSFTYTVDAVTTDEQVSLTLTAGNGKSRRTWEMDLETGRWTKTVLKPAAEEGSWDVAKPAVSTAPGWFMNVLREMGETETHDAIQARIDAVKTRQAEARKDAKAAKAAARKTEAKTEASTTTPTAARRSTRKATTARPTKGAKKTGTPAAANSDLVAAAKKGA